MGGTSVVAEWPIGSGNDLLTGLDAYYNFEQTSGNIVDIHGTYEGTDNANITYSQTGIIDNCMSFNGTSSFLELHTPPRPTTALGVSLWFNTSKTTDNYGGILNNYDSGGGYRIRMSYVGSTSQKITITMHNGVSYTEFNTDHTVICDGSWHHLVVSFDGTEVKAYIDNVLKSSSWAWNETLAYNGANLYAQIGSLFSTNTWFSGMIDEMALFSRALTATDASNLFNSGNGLPYSSFD